MGSEIGERITKSRVAFTSRWLHITRYLLIELIKVGITLNVQKYQKIHCICLYFQTEFIARKAKERNITLPVPDPVNQLEKWLHNQKKSAAQKDPANG